MKKLICFFLTVFSTLSFATQVEFYDGSDTDIAKRWVWACNSKEAKNGAIWIGYNIRHNADDNYKTHYHSGRNSNPALYELLGMNEPNDKLGYRDIALIFRLDNAPNNSLNISDVRFGSFDSQFNLKGLPIYWLHAADEKESTEWLKKLYPKQNDEVKEDLVCAFGLHRTTESTKMLIKLVKTETKDIQKDAVFWLGQPGHEEAFDVLVKTLKSHPQQAVRKAAVFSISQTETDQAVDILIETARSDESITIQKEAIFWLGQMAAEKSAETLNSIIYDAQTLELKKHAVFSLSQIEDDRAEDYLIKAAKIHPNLEVRKSAIFWLGEQGSDRALDVLVGILKK